MLRFWFAIFLFFSIIIHIINTNGDEHMVQSTAVRGKLICGQEPAIGVRVKLFEQDVGANSDDVLNETYTDDDGEFFIHGTTMEVGQIQPIVKVYHNCLYSRLFGLRRIQFLVPYHFTNYGIHAEKVLDLGTFNLEAILPRMMLQTVLLSFLILSNYQVVVGNRMQSVQIRGSFRCGEEIPHNATIELWDEDDPIENFLHQFFVQENSDDPDDKLFTTHPDINGTFEIIATHEEFTKLSLYMVVYHQCEHLIHCKSNSYKDRKLQTWRQFIFRIPQQYVNDGDKAVKVFDLGTWNLQFKFMVINVIQFNRRISLKF
ncbi:unnamed protein product [Cercopithifilaria johnstoni]|uniref:Transthyretin-like family protein n=1 Tax=Cercopithifilaria johnstoni TaxID=2874296 RepID=A0A8J2M0K4_9BILA|nr:unnamed protein product [Cercopithifilaria johnstoni]